MYVWGTIICKTESNPSISAAWLSASVWLILLNSCLLALRTTCQKSHVFLSPPPPLPPPPGCCARYRGLCCNAEMDHVKYLWTQTWRCKAIEHPRLSYCLFLEQKDLAGEKHGSLSSFEYCRKVQKYIFTLPECWICIYSSFKQVISWFWACLCDLKMMLV